MGIICKSSVINRIAAYCIDAAFAPFRHKQVAKPIEPIEPLAPTPLLSPNQHTTTLSPHQSYQHNQAWSRARWWAWVCSFCAAASC
jgi:hypothetical protein